MKPKHVMPLGAGLACLLLLVVMALFGVRDIMHSYLSAWLILTALPLGALPVLMGLDLLPSNDLSIEQRLRRLLGLMPVAAVLVLPVLIAGPRLYPALGQSTPGFPGVWTGDAFFTVRTIVMLLVWVGLALVFMRPAAGSRRGLAALGLALHVVFVSLAAQDWILALDPEFTSSASGLLLLSAQVGMALAVVGMTAPRRADAVVPRRLALALGAALAIWLFLAFTQYLVVWSANLPAEVAWYQHRSADLGFSAEVAAGLVCLAVFLVLPRNGPARSAGFGTAVAVLILILHAGGMLWLVTPAVRGHFSVTFADLLAIAGLVALGIGGARLFAPVATTGEVRRG